MPTMKRQSSVSTTGNTIILRNEDEGGERILDTVVPSPLLCIYVCVNALKEYGALQIRMKPRAWIYIEDLHRVA